jgi:hypothetical protein
MDGRDTPGQDDLIWHKAALNDFGASDSGTSRRPGLYASEPRGDIAVILGQRLANLTAEIEEAEE